MEQPSGVARGGPGEAIVNGVPPLTDRWTHDENGAGVRGVERPEVLVESATEPMGVGGRFDPEEE